LTSPPEACYSHSRKLVAAANATGFFIDNFLRRKNMALVKYGGGVTQMSGSTGGTTYARNRFGNYMRSRTKPVNPNTQTQDDIRTALSFLAGQWAAVVTAVQRSGWATYAAAIAMKNRLGESVYLTGFNHFLRSNVEAQRQTNLYTAAAPTELALPEKDTTFAVTGSVATQSISVVFNPALAWAIEAGGKMYVYQGTPRGKTRNFFNGPWKYLGSITGATPIPPTSPAVIVAPMALVLGQLVTCYARIRRLDGRISEPFTGSFVVAA
jgi:hypothetical protein